jgi:cholest-4-en-3-one 26-monooxygenase
MAAVDLGDPDTYTRGMPHEEFRRLRAEDPVSWQPEVDGRGFWAITRYHDVVAVLRTPKVFSSWRGGVLLPDPPAEFLEKLRENMLNRDPPDHTAMRRLVNKAFSPRRIEQLEERIEAHASQLVSAVKHAGRCDFATQIAGEMPLFVICEILGVPLADRRRLYALTERMFGSDIKDRAAALADGMQAANELRAYGAALGREKAKSPVDDMVSDLITAEIDGRRLTDGEFQAFFMMLFNAGADTTRSLLCYGLDLLLDRPDVMDRLRREPASVPAAIEEMLRFEPPVIQFRRTATQDTELAGRTIREGDKVVVFFPSANRDETVFVDPDRFDIDRVPNDHLGFGYGTHYCLGAPLARLESKHVFQALLRETRRIERAAPIEPSRTNFIRSIRRLEIAYQPL